jgi:hypothetical protein
VRALRAAVFLGLPLIVWSGCSAAPSSDRSYAEAGSGGAGGAGGAGAAQTDGGGSGGVAGDASTQDAQPNLCEGVSCTTPPPNTCEDENRLRVYATNGSCDGGNCSYSDQLVDCPNGCDGNACIGDPCIGVSCNTPPANVCADASHLAVYDVPGSCSDGTCGYDTHNQYCEFGCENGVCDGDPCVGVSCASPPANYCTSPEELVIYSTTGTCDAGACSYSSHEQFCEFGCTGGACSGDPCLGVTCNSPPADYCSAGDTLHEYGSSGSCSEGNCTYPAVDTFCSHGCDQGVCRECAIDTDCSGGLWCDDGSCKPCDENVHCGPSCADCTATGDVCNAGSTACVDCNVDGDCASGNWCSNNFCTTCDTVDHCGASCSACGPTQPNCEGFQCRCTSTSCGPHYLCAGGACAFCNTNSTCGPNCTACQGAAPYCYVEGTTSACVACLNDTQCTAPFTCDQTTHTCVDPCAVPTVACTTGSENRDGWSEARTISRTQAATTAGYQISDHTCNAHDNFNESSGCWDANGDHAYRIYLRESETIHLFMDSGWDCANYWNSWNMTLSIYGASGDCQSTTKGSRLFCLDQEYQHDTTYTAPHDGWFYLIVDGSHASDDDGDYVFQVKLTCNAAGCEC